MHSRRSLPVRRLHERRLLPAADLRLPAGLPSRGGLRAGALTVALVVACSGEATPRPEITDDDGLGNQFCDISCDADTSRNVDTAFAGDLTGALGDTFCPTGDVDYWRFSVPAGQDLVSLDASYEKLANMTLSLEWLGPKGACIPSPATTCDELADCGTGETCDQVRGGCRRIAADEACTTSAHCQSGEICAFAEAQLLTRLDEAPGSSTLHRVLGRVAAPVAGEYILEISDLSSSVCDSDVAYDLTARATADPDTHEPNDAVNMATALTSGTAVDGYLSHRGRGDAQSVAEEESDIDWYVITPAFGSRPVVTVDLRWPAGSEMEPTWTLVQGDWSLPSSRRQTLGSGVSAVHVRSAALVAPSPGPVFVKVVNGAASTDITNAYTLTVHADADSDELVARDDSPAEARTLALGGASTSAGDTGFIVAENDVDWYRITRSGLTGENSLVNVQVQAAIPDTSGYVLQLSFYRPSATACGASGTCAAGGRCNTDDDTCLTLFTVRPWVDALPGAAPSQLNIPDHGDPQVGGLTPNQLETQLPLYTSSGGVLYLEVKHNPAATAAVAGYSPSEGYTLDVAHQQEPDVIERTNPDNNWLPRPLALSEGQLRAQSRGTPRDVATVTSGGGGGVDFVALGFGAVPAGTQCVPVTLLGFDAAGAAVSGLSVTLGADTGSFVDDCGLQNPLTMPLVMTASSQAVSYVTAATTVAGNRVTTTVGATAASQALSVVAAGTSAISFANGLGLVPPRRFTSGASERVRLVLPAGATVPAVINVTAVNATLSCATSTDDVCVGDDSSFASPCGSDPAAGSSNCNIRIASGTTYDLNVLPSATGLLRVDAAAPAGAAFGSGTLVGTARAPLTVDPAAALTGYISYEGDNDFFSVPLGAVPPGGGTLWVTYPASRVDLAVEMRRGGGEVGVAVGNIRTDMCVDGDCPAGGSCDARLLCTQGVYNESAGPLAASPACTYLDDANTTLEIWVADMFQNDFDTTAQYSVDFSFIEGCSAECPSFVCP